MTSSGFAASVYRRRRTSSGNPAWNIPRWSTPDTPDRITSVRIFLDVCLTQLNALVRVVRFCIAEGFVRGLFFRIGFRCCGCRWRASRLRLLLRWLLRLGRGPRPGCPEWKGARPIEPAEKNSARKEQGDENRESCHDHCGLNGASFSVAFLFRVTPNLLPADCPVESHCFGGATVPFAPLPPLAPRGLYGASIPRCAATRAASGAPAIVSAARYSATAWSRSSAKSCRRPRYTCDQETIPGSGAAFAARLPAA